MVRYIRSVSPASSPSTLFQIHDGVEKNGVVGGGGGVLPVCGEVAGIGGKQRQPVAAGVPQTMLAPSCCCVTGSRNGLFANKVFGRFAEGLTTQLIQFDVLPASAQLPWT